MGIQTHLPVSIDLYRRRSRLCVTGSATQRPRHDVLSGITGVGIWASHKARLGNVQAQLRCRKAKQKQHDAAHLDSAPCLRKCEPAKVGRRHGTSSLGRVGNASVSAQDESGMRV